MNANIDNGVHRDERDPTAGADLSDGNRSPPAGALVLHRMKVQIEALRSQAYRRPSLLMSLLRTFDTDVYDHCVRVSRLSFRIGEMLDLDRGELRRTERAALIHDAGKICIPLEVLNKSEKLTASEWQVMRCHAAAGEAICFEATTDREISGLVRRHHERLDGSGYPDCLTAEKIPMAVRVLQMADIYDALVSKRSYKPAYSQEQALDILHDEIRSGWRDSRVVDALHAVLEAGDQ